MSQIIEQRRMHLAEYIRTHKLVTIKELPDLFNVSMNTIRKDIGFLTDSGIIKKVYGGVMYSNPDYYNYAPIPHRIDENAERKKAMAKKAAETLVDGDVIYIDYGTSTKSIPDYIQNLNSITVVTPNFYVISKLAKNRNANLIVLPGEYMYIMAGVMSEDTIENMRNYHFSKVFMACTGIDSNLNVATTSFIQREIKRIAVTQSEKCYLLAESSKFNSPGLLHYGKLSDFECVITDRNLSPNTIGALNKHSVNYIIADAENR